MSLNTSMIVSAASTKCPPWHPSFHFNLSILLPIPPKDISLTLDFGEDTLQPIHRDS